MGVEKKKRITLVGCFSIDVIKYPEARQQMIECVWLTVPEGWCPPCRGRLSNKKVKHGNWGRRLITL